MNKNKKTICIIGLGYVGLPLAIEFSKFHKTVGYDYNNERIDNLIKGNDVTNEVESNALLNQLKNNLQITSDPNELINIDIFIITVPTPVDEFKKPDLTPIISASKLVGSILKKNNFVIYESTVYPGLTEEVCIPILEKNSNLKLNKDFYVGYSPERINPGDKEKTLTNIVKVVSGSNLYASNFIDNLYSEIITAGTYCAPSIKVAEAAKVIENSQRDINIAFMNELSIIFSKMGIDTTEVLKAAGTKWNFLNFSPGLVGGHCIGVDPYYLAHKSQKLGYHPQIILAGRKINDSVSNHVVNEFVKTFLRKKIETSESNILIMGLTFKENCPDTRNSKVFDIISSLKELNFKNIHVYDPYVKTENLSSNNNISILNKLDNSDISKYNGIIIAVPHESFSIYKIEANNNNVIFDLKNLFNGKVKIDFKL
jgi:UDP-N-acetyl-D-glucosamine/UDP-N-acetyl-D-galactosamine dehydrogenase